MKRAFVMSLAAASGTAALAISSGAVAENATGAETTTTGTGTNGVSWYVSPMLQYSVQSPDDPQLKDNFGYQAGIGFNLPHEWAVEGDFSRGTFDIKGTDATRQLTGYSIDVIKKFFPQDLMQRVMLQPYALAGGGEMTDQLSAPDYGKYNFHTFLAEAGVGVLTGIGRQDGSTRVQLRTEAKYRMEFANADRYGVKDPSGIVFGVGVQMNFGERDERPPVVHTVEKVVEKEVVREVQAPPPPPPPLPPPPKGDIRLQGVTFATNSARIEPRVGWRARYDDRVAQAVPEPGARGAWLRRQPRICRIQSEAHAAPGRIGHALPAIAWIEQSAEREGLREGGSDRRQQHQGWPARESTRDHTRGGRRQRVVRRPVTRLHRSDDAVKERGGGKSHRLFILCASNAQRRDAFPQYSQKKAPRQAGLQFG